LDFPVNNFKRALGSGQQLIGLWSSLSSPAATEILADS
jgi:2-keto-3-deoxy-L-rhamnonate aldolase RhmA